MRQKARLLFSDTHLTKFMQGAGVFEPSKVLTLPLVEANVSESFGPENAQELATKSLSEPYRLIAMKGERWSWQDPEIKSVSFGDKWTTLDNYMEMM